MAGSTRDALLEQGALLFARNGVDRVTARQLHDAIGARNESALHYHFGGKAGLVREIVVAHLSAVEERRAPLVAAIEAAARAADLDALVHALAAPMAADLDTPLGRAHLRMVAQISHPSLAYQSPFRLVDAPAGRAVARWLGEALSRLPEAIRTERFAALRVQLVGLCGSRARLLDSGRGGVAGGNGLFLANLIDMLVAGLRAEPSPRTLEELAPTPN
ncbi:MAG TPA: TetR family transcriptional regulator [Stackebrandtia sp.]|uniref:TetR/AcrR family transcriptional regulator n=1 Tax=Stackebrandtia sp. TaxID=2023065 RepID=UPI002D67C59A|nr:TetR family transcriptional regulator [Stackebrandtia sp.]HZE38252.1 TetR family transcriptional regulator [Stackebrandtia sp.]